YDDDNYNRNDILNLLINSGYYEKEDNISLSSQYFIYSDVEGTYDLYVNEPCGIKLFKINVSENIKIKKNKKNNIGIIIFVIMIICFSVGIIVLILFKKKKHRLK
ncbi:MAG: hypothetical protein K5892_04565, partial [Acholeplasmatales bacterium]|nr:hypothetical protein [Acholeplasmatales bacterium]